MRCIKILILLAAILLPFTSVYAASNYNITTTKPSNINEWDICRRVLNNAGKDIFIPTKTLAEWQTFMNNLPPGVSLAFCTPTPPLSLSAARQGTQGLLSWSSPSTNYGSAITNIKIYRGTSSGSETLYATVGNVNSYTDPSVSSSLIYYYKVLAVNGGGDGDFSNEAQIGSCDPNIITTFGIWSSCSKTCGGGTRTRTNINQCGNSVTETDNNCNPTPCCDANVIVSCSGCAAGSCSTTCGSGTCTQTCTNQCGGTVQQTIGCTDTSDAGKILSCGSCGACSTKCGTGTCSKTCNLVCGGTTTQTDTCTDTSSVGVISSCGSYGPCSTACGTGTQTKNCIDQCANAVAQSQPCTDNGGLSVATSCSSYGTCSVTCGSGTQTRTCNNVCGSTFTQTQTCTGNGLFTKLFCGGWGSCSTTCGTGTQARTCFSLCGAVTESQGCTDNSGYSAISSCTGWGSCSKSCGSGTQARTCTNQCGGTSIETQSCNTQSCCDPNVITSCGACSTTCGSGTKTCTNQCGGTVTQDCYDTSGQSQFLICGGYGSCSTSCGTGKKYRTCISLCGGAYQDSADCTDTSDVGKVSGCTTSECSVSCGFGTQTQTCNLVCGGSFSNSVLCPGSNGLPGQSCSGCSQGACSYDGCIKDSSCACTKTNCWGDANSGYATTCNYYQCETRWWSGGPYCNQAQFCESSQADPTCYCPPIFWNPGYPYLKH